jgi:hypothetical protein
VAPICAAGGPNDGVPQVRSKPLGAAFQFDQVPIFDSGRAPRVEPGAVDLRPPATLRPLPGGANTRPLRSGLSFTGVPPGGRNAVQTDVPASVASAVGAFGTNLLRAALTARQPTPAATLPHELGLLSSMSGGERIAAQVRAPFERSFGYDLSPMRVHAGPAARKAASVFGAAAFTLGDHIVLGGGINMMSPGGQRIIGHELAHTVQSRLGGGSGRVSDPSWPSEREAERAAQAALGGRPYEIAMTAGDDLHQIAPWLILAGIGLVAGLVTWAASDSPEQNRARHAAGEADPTQELWTLVPLYGSVQQIRHAESYFQRVLGVGFLMLDFATLGSAGIAARALIRAPASLIRTVVTRQGGALVVREGGQIATEAAARQTATTFGREGGAIFASRSLAEAEMRQALQRGSLLVVTEGALNHSVIYAKNAAGQVLRIHGGPLRVLFEEAPRVMSPELTSSIARRTNAYIVVEMGQAAVSIEQAVATVQRSGFAWLRWLGGRPTSCGILQAALLEATGLPAETLARLVPVGGASARMLPITLLERAAAAGELRLVEGGVARIIGGTLTQGATLAAGGSLPLLTSSMMRFFVNEAVRPGPANAAGIRRPLSETDRFAQIIIRRFGRVLVGPASTVQAALPSIIPFWFVSSNEFQDSLRSSLIAAGMSPATARQIVP